MNTFAKKDDKWIIKSDIEQAAGQTVAVTMRHGSTKQVKLGAFIGRDPHGYYCYEVAPQSDELRHPGTPAARAETVGDLSRIVAMFARAAQYLKWPAVILDGFRVSVAGEKARQPGSLTVTSIEKAGSGRRAYYGRVTTAGVWEPGFTAPEGLGPKLKAFAANPAKEAARHGKLTGHCCFCRKVLGEGEDQRSVAVGYGPICADHFGLPWGHLGEHEEYEPTTDTQGAQGFDPDFVNREVKACAEEAEQFTEQERAAHRMES